MAEKEPIPNHPIAGLNRELAESLIAQRPELEQQKPYGVYFLEPPDPAIALAEAIELQEFERVFNNGPAVMEREYGPYRQASQFLLALDQQAGVPAGVMRIIVNSPAGLKSLNDLEKAPWDTPIEQLLTDSRLSGLDLDNTWDIGTIAITPQYQGLRSGLKVGDAMLRSVLGLARNRGVTHFVAIIDDDVLRLRFDRLTNPPPFERFTGLQPAPYLESPSSTPVYGSLAEMEQRALQMGQRRHDRFFEGVGLEDVSFPAELQPA